MIRHTRFGWIDDDTLFQPHMSIVPSDASVSYFLEYRECSHFPRSVFTGATEIEKALSLSGSSKKRGASGKKALRRALEKEKDAPYMTFAECVLLLSNISLGVRTTTSQGESKFIDRPDRTFLKRTLSPLSLAFTQDAVRRLSSLANYIHARKWDESYGAIEALYEEYLAICGDLAWSLFEASKRMVASGSPASDGGTSTGDTDAALSDAEKELEWASPSNKSHNLYTQSLPFDVAFEIADRVAKDQSVTLAVKVVEGAMISCAVRDRSSISKDKSNVRLKHALKSYLGVSSAALAGTYKSATLVCPALIDYLLALADTQSSKAFIVLDGDEEITSFCDYIEMKEQGETKGAACIREAADDVTDDAPSAAGKAKKAMRTKKTSKTDKANKTNKPKKEPGAASKSKSNSKPRSKSKSESDLTRESKSQPGTKHESKPKTKISSAKSKTSKTKRAGANVFESPVNKKKTSSSKTGVRASKKSGK